MSRESTSCRLRPACRCSVFSNEADPALVDPGVTAQLECLFDDVVVGKQAFKLRRHPRIDQGRVGLFENTEQRPSSPGQFLFFSPPMISARRSRPSGADALGLPRRSRRTSSWQSARHFRICLRLGDLVVRWRWPGLLVLDFRIVQLRSLAVPQPQQQLRLVLGGAAVRESCAPAEINRADGRKRGGGGHVGPRDDVEQFFLIGRQARPHLRPFINRVDVGNNGVMAPPPPGPCR